MGYEQLMFKNIVQLKYILKIVLRQTVLNPSTVTL